MIELKRERITKDMVDVFYNETLLKMKLTPVFPDVHIILRGEELLWVMPTYLQKFDFILTEKTDDRFWKAVFYGTQQNQSVGAKNLVWAELNKIFEAKETESLTKVLKSVRENMEESIYYFEKASRLNWFTRTLFPGDIEKAKGLESDYDGIMFVLTDNSLEVKLKDQTTNRFLESARKIDLKSWWNNIYNSLKNPLITKPEFFSYLTGGRLFIDKLETTPLDKMLVLDDIFKDFIEKCQYIIYPSIHRAAIANDELNNDYSR